MGLREDDRFYRMLDSTPRECWECGEMIGPEDEYEQAADRYFCMNCASPVYGRVVHLPGEACHD